MSQEVLGRASDPFFTTKEPGRGIGLGLFLTRNVISQLGGQLEFRSSLGRGTEAIVCLPLGTADATDDEHPADRLESDISRKRDALTAVAETEMVESVKWTLRRKNRVSFSDWRQLK